MQFFLRIIRIDIIAKFMLTRGNMFFWLTSSTFIFDRGENGKNAISQKSTVSWSIYLKQKYFIHHKPRHLKNRMSNSKMPSMFT